MIYSNTDITYATRYQQLTVDAQTLIFKSL